MEQVNAIIYRRLHLINKGGMGILSSEYVVGNYFYYEGFIGLFCR